MRLAASALAAARISRGMGHSMHKWQADQGPGSTPTGDLPVGDSASPAGFNFAGQLRTHANSVTLNSSAPATLGNLTALGTAATPGTLNAASGVVINFGSAVTGFGTINSSDTLAKHSVINGT